MHASLDVRMEGRRTVGIYKMYFCESYIWIIKYGVVGKFFRGILLFFYQNFNLMSLAIQLSVYVRLSVGDEC